MKVASQLLLTNGPEKVQLASASLGNIGADAANAEHAIKSRSFFCLSPRNLSSFNVMLILNTSIMNQTLTSMRRNKQSL